MAMTRTPIGTPTLTPKRLLEKIGAIRAGGKNISGIDPGSLSAGKLSKLKNLVLKSGTLPDIEDLVNAIMEINQRLKVETTPAGMGYKSEDPEAITKVKRPLGTMSYGESQDISRRYEQAKRDMPTMEDLRKNPNQNYGLSPEAMLNRLVSGLQPKQVSQGTQRHPVPDFTPQSIHKMRSDYQQAKRDAILEKAKKVDTSNMTPEQMAEFVESLFGLTKRRYGGAS